MCFWNSSNIKAGIQLGLPPNVIYLSVTVPTPLADVSWFRFFFCGSCIEQDVRGRFLMDMVIFRGASQEANKTWSVVSTESWRISQKHSPLFDCIKFEIQLHRDKQIQICWISEYYAGFSEQCKTEIKKWQSHKYSTLHTCVIVWHHGLWWYWKQGSLRRLSLKYVTLLFMITVNKLALPTFTIWSTYQQHWLVV